MQRVQLLEFHPENKVDLEKVLAELDRPLNPHYRRFIDFRGAALYSPAPYLPQAVGILAGRLAGTSPLVIFYLGRFANLAAWIALMYLALRTVPLFKWVFFMLALAPITLFLASSLSADGLTNALAFLLTAVFLHSAYQRQDPVSRGELVVLLALGILLALSKQAYVSLMGLFLLIPAARFESLKQRIWMGAVLLVIPVAASLVWSSMVGHLFIPNCIPD
jgi:uncharacterized membrane protein